MSTVRKLKNQRQILGTHGAAGGRGVGKLVREGFLEAIRAQLSLKRQDIAQTNPGNESSLASHQCLSRNADDPSIFPASTSRSWAHVGRDLTYPPHGSIPIPSQRLFDRSLVMRMWTDGGSSLLTVESLEVSGHHTEWTSRLREVK